MDRNSVIGALFLLYRRRKRRRDRLILIYLLTAIWLSPGSSSQPVSAVTRCHWVHPIIQKRKNFGAFYTLFGELRDEANKYSNNLRMSVSSFDEMHRLWKKSLQRRNSKMRNCIQPVEMLAVAVR